MYLGNQGSLERTAEIFHGPYGAVEPGFAGFESEIPEHSYNSYRLQDQQEREYHHYEGDRIPQITGIPCLKVEVRPLNLERGDSENQKCATCVYDRDVRPAGLPSSQMWRCLNPEDPKYDKYKKYETPSRGKRYKREEMGETPFYYCHGKCKSNK
ncbi:hypothetical protein NPIL_143511 [Nephila pilipes]|uniref:Uncharacterized protein n=1 Tax=Nephila pilipes TaxID=299642 RepID=A0A8X6Q0W8_NEPPI|nr:hypothetical protein NPIL_143511 [Nephila pilipes]